VEKAGGQRDEADASGEEKASGEGEATEGYQPNDDEGYKA